MASETQTPDFSAAFERLLRDRYLSLLLPSILGPPSSSQETRPEEIRRIVLVNPLTQSMVALEGDSLLDVMGSKNGPPPASKASIDAMPSVDVGEIKDEVGDCVICLEDWGDADADADVVVKEMPCKHRFHSNCIERWLRVHGSCPVCRYQMPVEERKRGKEEGGERRRVEEIWVTFAFSRRRSSEDNNQSVSPESSDDTARPRPEDELDG